MTFLESEPIPDRSDDFAEAMRLLSRYDQGALWCYLDREERLEQYLPPDIGGEARHLAESLLALPAESAVRERAVRDMGPANARAALSAALSPPRSPARNGLRVLLPGIIYSNGDLTFLLASITYGLTALVVDTSIYFQWPNGEPFWDDSVRGQMFEWDGYRYIVDDVGTRRTNAPMSWNPDAPNPHGGWWRRQPPLTVLAGLHITHRCAVTNTQTWFPGVSPAASILRLALPSAASVYLPGDPRRLLYSLSLPVDELSVHL